MEEFCGQRFWDWNLTWYTGPSHSPDFTSCFESTVLAWIPPAFLWTFAPLTIICTSWNSKSQVIPWTPLNITKSIITLALAFLQSILFLRGSLYSADKAVIYPVQYVTPVIRATTFIFALSLMLYEKTKGIRSSGVQFNFWFLLLACEVFGFRSQLLNSSDPERMADTFDFAVEMIYFPLILAQLFLNCWADAPAGFTQPKEMDVCPEEGSSYLSKFVFSWFGSLAWKGYTKTLQQSDLWDLNNGDKSSVLVPKFDKHRGLVKAKVLRSELKKANQSSNPAATIDQEVSLLRVLFGTFGFSFFFASFLKCTQDILVFVTPEILRLLIAFVSGNEETWKGYLYTAMIFIVAIVQMLLQAHFFHRMLLVGMRIKTVLVSAVFRKTLALSNSARSSSTVGEIVNLMSVDTQKIQDMVLHLSQLWDAPMQIGLAMYFLWQTIGPSSLAGFVVMILLIPMNAIIVSKMKKLQIVQMKKKDQRVKLTNEILSGIKVLKLYAWELSFQQHVLHIRDDELRVLRKAAYLHTGISFVWLCAPFLVSMVTFGTYVMIDERNVLDPEKAFVCLTLFNILKRPLTVLPLVITSAIQASVSLKRLTRFLNAEEIDQTAVGHDTFEKDPIIIEDGTFAWSKETCTLRSINLRVKEGSICAIVGEVGSGKSSLLSAILGELDKISGRVNTKGSVAYVSQQAWIQNETVKDNVLFGKPFEWSKYSKIIESCALNPDLEILPAGDQTEIGEKGINLSGGQKQRISLARAVYNNADVYLLDDPLSAVDSHVGKHIFEHVIGRKGILKKKTRVLVTHGITYLSEMDFIVVMSGGEITETGTYKELLSKKGAFSEFLIRHLDQLDEMKNGELSIMDDIERLVGAPETFKILSRQVSRSSGHENSIKVCCSVSQDEGKADTDTLKQTSSLKQMGPSKEGEMLIKAETSLTGSTNWRVYAYYAKSVGLQFIFCIFGLYFIFESCSAYSNVWLSDWSNEPTVNGTQDVSKRNMYLSVYAALGTGQMMALMTSGLALAYGTLKASSILHSDMLQRILRAPSWFFDTTPTGRIVNRFAKDVDTCDLALPNDLRDFLTCFFKVFSTIAIICYSTPLFTAVILPTGLLYLLVQRFYVATSRQLKRLESVSRSPIYSHFTETINGCTTIRAFAVQERFIEDSESSVDCNQRAYYAGIVSNRWLGIRLEFIGSVLILFASLFAVIGRGSISPGLVGLGVSYALQITPVLNWMVRVSTSVETNMVAAERLREYAEVPQEAPLETHGRKPSKTWPEFGALQFDGYQTRYRDGLDLVLRDVTAKIEPAEKIGIVGRTGSGKSSLALGLFRLLESAGGSICIDEHDISDVGLLDLRNRLTIIPQDPVLFSGTLRVNLDPFSRYDDDTVWRSLELSHLKTFVTGLTDGLNYEVSEGGQNLSVGQRQLICLARALLRKSKILVLDEATAQVDLDTDELIQQTIKSEFKDSTVLTIAHRINTIMNSTRVMVLDNGKICEFDRPEVLLKNRDSAFYKMAKVAGVVQ